MKKEKQTILPVEQVADIIGREKYRERFEMDLVKRLTDIRARYDYRQAKTLCWEMLYNPYNGEKVAI